MAITVSEQAETSSVSITRGEGERDLVWAGRWKTRTAISRTVFVAFGALELVVFLLLNAGVPVVVAAGMAVVAALGPAGAILYRERIRNALRSRTMAKLPLLPSLASVSRGDRVRVRGQIRANRSFPSSLGARRAVLAIRYGRRQDGRFWQEVRGVPFSLQLSGGEQVGVDPSSVHFLNLTNPLPEELDPDRPLSREEHGGNPRGLSIVLAEISLCHGDEVELCGSIDSGPLPEQDSGGFRGARVGHFIAGTPARPVLVKLTG